MFLKTHALHDHFPPFGGIRAGSTGWLPSTTLTEFETKNGCTSVQLASNESLGSQSECIHQLQWTCMDALREYKPNGPFSRGCPHHPKRQNQMQILEYLRCTGVCCGKFHCLPPAKFFNEEFSGGEATAMLNSVGNLVPVRRHG